ncbi:MAG: RES family NAD+ phosphorylase [Gammaproteobacteria bacterium]|nr:RES family NAD+ phosphorylase [Gammaproteobacteria bacterium]
MIDIWSACRQSFTPRTLQGELIRIVESQEQVATTALVDDLQEQDLLEQMLEYSKPPRRPATESLHYLLATPFRYPPLPHGSRLGSRFEPGLLYGSQQTHGVLAEAGYYRLVFWAGMQVPPPSGTLVTEHTVFGARYHSAQGAALQHPPFAAYEKTLTDPADYAATQQLGSALRSAGIEAIEYLSARTVERTINVGLLSPAALASPRPTFQQHWLCRTRAGQVGFYSSETREVHTFARESFLVRGQLPSPCI